MHGKFTQSNSSSKKKDRKQKKLAEQNGEPTRVQRILLKQASKPCELSVNYEIDPKKILRAFCDSEIMKPLNDAGVNYPPKFGPVNKVQIMVGKTDDDEDPEGVREGI